MKKLFASFFVLMLTLNFYACDGDSGSAPAMKVDYDYSGANPPAYATLASADLHYTLPDQKNYAGDVADEKEELFDVYDPTLVLTEGIVFDSTTDPVTTVSGYALDQFVKKDTVNAATPDPDGKLGDSDARKLYSIVLVSNNDGFNNRSKFGSKGYYNSDLRWDQFIQGYLLDLNYSGKSFFPESVGLIKMYNNNFAYDIYMFRKIDVKRPDSTGSIATFEVGATSESYVDDSGYTTVTGLSTTKFNVAKITFTNGAATYTDVNAISLDQYITTYITDSPSDYTYTIVAVDDFSRSGWSYANMQQAYYLPDYEFICRIDSSTNTMVSGTKINFPVRIEVKD